MTSGRTEGHLENKKKNPIGLSPGQNIRGEIAYQ
jgi:hypothetical protein